MDAMNNNTAQPVEGAGRDSATNRGIPPANGVANGEAVIDQRRAQRTASAASLEERVRTETSQFDFTTLVGLGTGNGGANGSDGVSPLDRAEAIAWPMRAVHNTDPESVDGIVPEAFAPPAEPTLKLIVKTTPTPAERRRSALRTGRLPPARSSSALRSGGWRRTALLPVRPIRRPMTPRNRP